MTLVLRYDLAITDHATILNLLRRAGIMCGIGEMRNEKKIGTFGSFSIDPSSVVIAKIEV